MRTNIDLDKKLADEAKKLSGIATYREVVDRALRVFVAQKKRRPIADLLGKFKLSSDYDYKKLRN